MGLDLLRVACVDWISQGQSFGGHNGSVRFVGCQGGCGLLRRMTDAAKLRRATGTTGDTAARRAMAAAERCKNMADSSVAGRSDVDVVAGGGMDIELKMG